jgi:hypothetical protein
MKICFYSGDPFWGGLSNNGGTRTILKSAEVLREMGHQVDVVAVSDRFTWFPHPKPLRKIPKDADAVVAISASDVKYMHLHAKGMKLFWWIRGWETWQMPEKKLLNRLLAGQVNIANSGGLQKRVEAVAPCKLCWAGMDNVEQSTVEHFDKLKTIGFLGRTMRATKRWDLCRKLVKVLPEYKYEVLCGVKDGGLNNFYEKIGIWFAPTESEGFHNPPAEAALRGALVVCNRLESNGMTDYATDETAMRYDVFEEALEYIKNPDFTKVKKMQDLLWDKIGSREKNMAFFVEALK